MKSSTTPLERWGLFWVNPYFSAHFQTFFKRSNAQMFSNNISNELRFNISHWLALVLWICQVFEVLKTFVELASRTANNQIKICNFMTKIKWKNNERKENNTLALYTRKTYCEKRTSSWGWHFRSEYVSQRVLST